MKNADSIPIQIPRASLETWQEIVDIMADMMDVPAGLIMKLEDPDIAVLAASKGNKNPYHPGDREPVWGSGLYCEQVIKTGKKLAVPDALKDPHWENNPDIKFNMIAYLGLPVRLPDGKPFGTICVLDSRKNPFSSRFEKLMMKFRDMIQADLELIYMNQILGDRNRKLTDYIKELKVLRGIVPICAGCKSIRDKNNQWHPVEHYLSHYSGADFTHSMCPRCMNKMYPDYKEGK